MRAEVLELLWTQRIQWERLVAARGDQLLPVPAIARLLEADETVLMHAAGHEAPVQREALLAVYDAHDRDDLAQMFRFALDESRETQMLVALRPYKRDAVEFEAVGVGVAPGTFGL